MLIASARVSAEREIPDAPSVSGAIAGSALAEAPDLTGGRLAAGRKPGHPMSQAK
ncbi:MAG: hypothetical protein JSS60_04745 [Verrucomicrobia bacterium]|nr:hypothetical protein [Verrucomicrobiota bacterium]